MTDIETMPGIGVALVNKIVVDWRGDHRFDAGRPGGVPIRLDASATTGPGPVDGLLSAFGSCTAVDVVDILAKRRTPVASLHIDVQGARADAVPKRLIGVHLAYTITGDGIEREHAERAIELAVTKYCSVGASLDPAIPVRWTLVLNGE